MAQDMVERIREAEQQGEELERQAAARANARLVQVNEEIAALRQQARQMAADQDAASARETAEVCERIRVEAQEKADKVCGALSKRAEDNRACAVRAAAALLEAVD